MTAVPEKSATLNFRVRYDVSEMLRQLAEDAGMSMTDYVVTFIRATYKHKFPDKARTFETAKERLEREIARMSQMQLRDAIDDLAREIAQGLGSSELEELATVKMDRARRSFDRKHGVVDAARPEEERTLAELGTTVHERSSFRRGKKAIEALRRLERFYVG